MKLFKVKLIIKIVLIVVVLVILGVVITIGAMNIKAITNQYNNLSNKPINSARQFRIPFGYITVSPDGSVDIQFAAQTEFQQVNPDIDDVVYTGAEGEDDRQQSGPDYQGDVDSGGIGGSGDGCDASNHLEVCVDKSCANGGVEVTSTTMTFTYPYDIYYYDNDNKVRNCVKGDYGMSRLFENSNYINFDWSDGSLQEKLCDMMKSSSEYDGSGDFATYKGYPLTAAAPHVSTLEVGSIIRVTYLIDSTKSATEYQDWVVVDVKAGEGKEDGYANVAGYVWESNDVQAGHYMWETYSMDILEVVRKDNTNNSSFNRQFGKKYTGKSRIIKVEVIGSVM